MLGRLKKAFALGVKAAKITKKEAEKEINAMVKAGIINKNEGRDFLRKIMAEANAERQRFQRFVESEVKREIKKAKPLAKEVARRSKLVAKRAAPKIRRVTSKAMSKARSKAGKAVRKRVAKARVKVRSIRKKKR